MILVCIRFSFAGRQVADGDEPLFTTRLNSTPPRAGVPTGMSSVRYGPFALPPSCARKRLPASPLAFQKMNYRLKQFGLKDLWRSPRG